MTPRGRSDSRAVSSRARARSPERPSEPRGGLAALRDRLATVIAPVTQEAGFDLERVSVSRAGRRHRVQVVVDRDQGVGLDAIAEVSRALSAALDRAEEAGAAVVPGEYVLEVSSPGVDRPLTEPRHWRRNLGRLVAVNVAGEGQVTGRVVAAGSSGVTLDMEGNVRELPYAELGPGRVQVELRSADGGEPGGDLHDLDHPEDPGGEDAADAGAHAEEADPEEAATQKAETEEAETEEAETEEAETEEAETENTRRPGGASGTGGRPDRRSGKGGA